MTSIAIETVQAYRARCRKFEDAVREEATKAGRIIGTYESVFTERSSIFKWIKGNLKIRSFLGTSVNAVKTQIWCALCVYLMVAYLKFFFKSPFSLSKLRVRVRANLMEKVDLVFILFQELQRTRNEDILCQMELAFDG